MIVRKHTVLMMIHQTHQIKNQLDLQQIFRVLAYIQEKTLEPMVTQVS